jgi:hypothetical protein
VNAKRVHSCHLVQRSSKRGGRSILKSWSTKALGKKCCAYTFTGEGLAEALKGAQVVVGVANAPSWEDKAVLEFFETAGPNLLAAEAATGVRHHAALSIVGADRLPASGYLRAKMAQENLIKGSGIPFTRLRAGARDAGSSVPSPLSSAKSYRLRKINQAGEGISQPRIGHERNHSEHGSAQHTDIGHAPKETVESTCQAMLFGKFARL